MSWQDRDYARGARRGMGGMGGGMGYAGRRGFRYDAVTVLIAINVVIYVLCLLTARSPRAGAPSSPLFEFGVLYPPAVLHGQVWRLLTATYLHWYGMHIFMNMLGLYFFGRALLQVWGARKFVVFYTLAGVLANVFYVALTVIKILPSASAAAGASGCVLGLLGAAAVMFPHAEVLVYFLFPLKIRTVAVVFGLWFAYNVYTSGNNAGGDACHLAGLLFGLWYAWRGDLWWRQSGVRRMLTGHAADRIGGGQTASASPNPGGWARKLQERQVDAAEVDRILKKVHDGGLHTLTPQEKRTLAAATEQERDQDVRARRGW
jgi:membrane associated rhomboid family serine protease